MSEKFQNKYRVSSTRLPKWDYSNNGYYFVPICVADRKCVFGEVKKGQMFLNNIGDIAQGFWLEIPRHFPFVMLDEFVIMPNHIHGILTIDREFISDSDDDYKLFPNKPMVAYTTPVKSHVPAAIVETLQCNVSTRNDADNTNKIHEFYSKISPKPESLSTVICSFKSVCTKTINKLNNKINFVWQERFFDEILRDETALFKIRDYIKNNPAKWEGDRNNPVGLRI